LCYYHHARESDDYAAGQKNFLTRGISPCQSIIPPTATQVCFIQRIAIFHFF